MIVRKTPWEDRNLGLSTVEVILEEGDSRISVKEQLRDLNEDFRVVRTPIQRIDLSEALSELGFYFSEALFKLRADVARLSLFSGEELRKRKLEIATASTSEKNTVRDAVLSSLFQDDRISQDPSRLSRLSASRYWNWICDELELGGELKLLKSPSRTLGFFLIRIAENDVVHVALSGSLVSDERASAGLALQHAVIKACHELGASSVDSRVSSNNLKALRANIAAGYVITGCEYVFTYRGIRVQ